MNKIYYSLCAVAAVSSLYLGNIAGVIIAAALAGLYKRK